MPGSSGDQRTERQRLDAALEEDDKKAGLKTGHYKGRGWRRKACLRQTGRRGLLAVNRCSRIGHPGQVSEISRRISEPEAASGAGHGLQANVIEI